mmetsp:Transcript_56849/g.151803  ORF Transcript_56849/g.151803 Transcript_56849/m.151803 type:complete len:296 (-) Transcript_56849:494-1381(-)
MDSNCAESVCSMSRFDFTSRSRLRTVTANVSLVSSTSVKRATICSFSFRCDSLDLHMASAASARTVSNSTYLWRSDVRSSFNLSFSRSITAFSSSASLALFSSSEDFCAACRALSWSSSFATSCARNCATSCCKVFRCNSSCWFLSSRVAFSCSSRCTASRSAFSRSFVWMSSFSISARLWRMSAVSSSKCSICINNSFFSIWEASCSTFRRSWADWREDTWLCRLERSFAIFVTLDFLSVFSIKARSLAACPFPATSSRNEWRYWKHVDSWRTSRGKATTPFISPADCGAELCT